jgi:glycosyltransferase involved in cell wall biosynthesis
MRNPWADIQKSLGWLRDLVAQTSPDCLQFNHYAPAAVRWRLPVVVVAHSCVWSWWQAVHGATPGEDYARYHACVRAAIHTATYVVTPSADMLASVHHNYGAPARSTVIPNGIELLAFAPRPKLPYVLTAGRLWDEAKNVQALERIASQLRWPIYVAGETFEPGAPAAYGGARTTACRLLGALDRTALASCLGRASIYALPARYEPFGLSVLEAAAAGCALVLGAIPSLQENWAGAAHFVHPEDPQALRQVLEQLIANRKLREHWSALARARANELTAKRMADQYAQLYRDAIAAARAGGLACAS